MFYYYWKHNLCRLCVRNPASGLLQIIQKSEKDNDITIFRHDANIKFSWRCFVSLLKFCYLSKFNVNIITGSGIMEIYFYKGLTRNPEIGNTPVWVLPNIWRLGRVMDTKFGTNISNRMLLQNSRVAAFTVFELLRKNQLRGGKITPSSFPHPD